MLTTFPFVLVCGPVGESYNSCNQRPADEDIQDLCPHHLHSRSCSRLCTFNCFVVHISSSDLYHDTKKDLFN